ncbi:PREDICTED: calcium and integrin-binding protein 1-like isoform X2 [Nicrophorus vespilloides]|nr:PREDICTED: calcium and integrin-binding protein 1-like isoform X2 [Nicrophorus vespilloides]
MGGKSSRHYGLTDEKLIEYTELTYLTRTEILHLLKLFVDIDDIDIEYHRIAFGEIISRFPQLEHNPFRSRIRRVFSSKKDDCFSFEDLLDYASAMSDRCPSTVKSAWAFKLYDFDEDGQLGLDDIVHVIKALTEYRTTTESRIDVNQIAQIV